MKKLTRIFMLFLLSALSVSCADNSAVTDHTYRTDDSPAVQTSVPDYETRDLGKREFVFLNCPRDLWSMHCAIAPDEITGEEVNDLMFGRNRYVEDTLNCSITERNTQTIADVTAMMRTAVLAGDDEYQIAYIPMYTGVTAISEELIHDLSSFDELQFDREWWNRELLESSSIGGKNYFAASSLHLMSIDGIWCVFFNQNMMDDLGLGYPYELVRSGKWTVSEMLRYIKAASNLNGDDSFSPFSFDGNSVYGCVSITSGIPKFLYGAGMDYVVNENDVLTLNIKSRRFIDVLEKYTPFFSDSGMFVNVQATGDFASYTGGITPYIAAFTQNRALFIGTEVKVANTLRGMEQPFGVLPFPKLDETQENYRSTALHQLSVATIPVTAKSPEDCALLLDVLSCESEKRVLDRFISNTIEQKGLRNEESIEMLGLIRQTLSFDPGVAFQIATDLENKLRDDLVSGSEGFASDIAALENSLREKLDVLAESTK